MSTCYRFEPALSLADFRAGFPKLAEHGIQAVETPQDNGKIATQLKNGEHYLEYYTGDETDVGLERWGLNRADLFIDTLAEVYDRNVLSEHDEGYFEDEEDWEAFAGEE